MLSNPADVLHATHILETKNHPGLISLFFPNADRAEFDERSEV